MAINNSRGMPVKITEYSETSLIVSFFTREFGLVRTIYKGARRKAKAYQSTVDLLVLGELSYYERKSGLNILKEFLPKENFPGLHNDIERYRAAMACLEFVRMVSVENEPAAGLFDIFLNALKACANGRFVWSGVYSFIMNGLSETGFAPALEACASCASPEFPHGKNARIPLAFEDGGALCMKCATKKKAGMWLTTEAHKVLLKLQNLNPVDAARRELKHVLAREVKAFLRRYSEFTFEQPFRMIK
jgi:DNA repair protein RecO (recombination protein O)